MAYFSRLFPHAAYRTILISEAPFDQMCFILLSIALKEFANDIQRNLANLLTITSSVKTIVVVSCPEFNSI